MKKEFIIGGLALLGVIGVVAYLKKPKRNEEGFFSANGRMSRGTTGGCALCYHTRDRDYMMAENGSCRRGYICKMTKREQALLAS